MKRRFLSRLLSAVLMVVILVASVVVPSEIDVQAATYSTNKKFYLSEAKKLAVSKSKEYKKIKVDILTKQANYADAVMRIKVKKKRLSTFTWSPLLSFHFPEDPGFTDEYEFNFKPISIQGEITNLRHKLSDQLYAIYEEITNLYVSAYTLQEKIAFNQELLESKKETLEKNKYRLLKGLASQNDIDSIEKSIKKLEDTISTDMTSLENKKDKLKDKTGVDVRTGFEFVNPYIDTEIAREDLTKIQDYTIEHSQAMFEARSNTKLSETTLDLYYSLMRSAYGNKMNRVSVYYQMAKRGQEVDGEALKTQFDQLLVDIDQKWSGKKRIVFVRIPRVRWQGETDGSRYVEDEPYALYNAILDYQSVRIDQTNTEKDIREQVKDSFENLKSLEKAYRNLLDTLETEKADLKRALIQNQLGELPFEEYTTQQEQYEADQIEAMTALDDYTQAITSLDRLSCGALSLIIGGAGINAETTVGGDSYLIPEEKEGIMYYIKVAPESNVFDLGLYVPDELEVEFDKFELWIDQMKVGDASPDSTIRHLGLTLDGSERVFLRFYNGEEFVCDYDIDPSVYSGPVTLITGYHLKPMEEINPTLGTYMISESAVTGLQTFKFEPDANYPDVASYKLTDLNGTPLVDSTPVPVEEERQYIALLTGSEDILEVQLFDKDDNLLETGVLDSDTMTVIKKGSSEGGAAE